MDGDFNLFLWLWYSVPWEIKLLVLGFPLAAAAIWSTLVFGWDRTWRWAAGAALAVVTLGIYNRAQQQGWQAKVKKDLEAADRMIERARRTRADAERKMMEDPDAIREDDGFRRPD